MKLRSLRARVIVGSLLWTAGLLAVAHMLMLSLLKHFPVMTRMDHHRVLAAAIVCMAAGLWGLQSGLSPFGELRRRLGAVRDGSAPRVEGEYPTEVQPLVNDLNALLEHREKVVNRALATAGDLAHGLKTPLAVLAQEVDGSPAAQQVERMRRQIEYHLARARAAASGATPGAHCAVAASAEPLARTLQRLYAERGLEIHVDAPAGHAVRCQREDLDEMLGNLLDNACKWGRSRIALASCRAGDAFAIVVDDDGPGLAPELRSVVLRRGVRADEAAPGSGMGLAIVRDLAELYGGSIALEQSPAGGLRARLELPAS
jgi:signal transduction histidine kinase